MDGQEYQITIENRIKEQQWLDLIIESGECCWLCGYYNDASILHPVQVEEHHVAGSKNSSVIIYLCPNCHSRITKYQHSKHKEWNDIPESQNKRMALMLKGWSLIDRLRARIEDDFSEKLLRCN